MLTKILMVSAVFTVLTANGVLAAPFCAVFAWGKQCDFGTYEECLRAAGSSGGCEFNSQEDKPAPGAAPFCLVTPYETQCIFDDAVACRMTASLENSDLIKQAECVANPNH